MDSKLIGIIADQNIDLNFLVWSIYYLSGQPKYYYHGLDYWFEVDDEPLNLTGTMARVEVEVDGASQIIEFTDMFNQIKGYSDRPGFRIFVTRVQENTEPDPAIISRMQEECGRVLVVSTSGKPSLYFNKIDPADHEDRIDEYLEAYFADSKVKWGSNIVDPWNKREFMALNIRPYISVNATKYVDRAKEHFLISYLDLFQNLDKILYNLVNFLDMDSFNDEEKITHWHKVYYTWRSTNCEQIMWDQNFDVIIDSIVNGYKMDLSVYTLDELRQAAIQHALLYKHNLAIKGYGIETLPNTTQGIHELLEPNFHELPPY